MRNQPFHIVTFTCEIPLRIKGDHYADNEDRNISTHQSFGLHPTWWRSWSLLSRTTRNKMKQGEIKATRGYYWTISVTQEKHGLKDYSNIVIRRLEILTKRPVHMNRNPHQPVSWSSRLKLQVKNVNKFRYCNVLFECYVRIIIVKTS